MNSLIVESTLNDLKKILERENLFLIIDSTVFKLYADLFKNCPKVVEVTAGEELKSLDSFAHYAEEVLSLQIKRNDRLLAVGGGTVSDFAGFLAATLLRGMEWSVIPTTLLSMVDASIGGKTGINSKHGKNLIGAFHFPQEIYIVESFLKTLGEDEFKNGMGEVVKYAFISEPIYKELYQNGLNKKVISECMSYKQKIVTEDPYEKGIRKVLNLGHTLGHAIELREGLTHGIAVLCGMRSLFSILDRKEELKRFDDLLQKLSLNLPQVKIHQNHLHYIVRDKKRESEHICFVLPDATVVEMSQSELTQLICDEN